MDQKLHRLTGAQFQTLYRNLALPPGDPIIRRIMPQFFRRSQVDILELEAKANGNSMKLSQDALQRMGQRYGVTLAQLLAVLRGIPESQLIFNLLGFADLLSRPGSEIQPQQPLLSVFHSRTPTDGVLVVDEGDTALFRVTLRDIHRDGTVVTWHKGLTIGVLCNGPELRIKIVTAADQGQYRCIAKLQQQPEGTPRPSLVFSLKVRTRAQVNGQQRQPQSQLQLQPQQHQWEKQRLLQALPPPMQAAALTPKKPPPHDMQRTHKYALIVSCQKYHDRHIPQLGCGSTTDLEDLRDHLSQLGYRSILLLDPSRIELLSVIQRLRCMLAQCNGPAPHLFLLLDGHGTVTHTTNAGTTTTSCFLPSDAVHGQPDSFLRVEEDILLPLTRCLPNRRPNDASDGLLVAVFDMCRSLDPSTVAATDGSGIGHLSASVQEKRIQRLHATSYAEMAASLVGGSKGRQSFGVAALNRRLLEDKCFEERLRPQPFLMAVSDTISGMSKRYHNQSPELQVSASDAKLCDMVFLSDPHAIQSANRVVEFVRPAWRKFALLIGAGQHARCGLRDLPCVRPELSKVQGALQLLGYHTVVCCDLPGGRDALLAVVADFCNLLRSAAYVGGGGVPGHGHPVQAMLLVDGHGELSTTDGGDAEARSLFLVPDAGDGVGCGHQSVDIEFELARPIFDAMPKDGRHLVGFYDACRSCRGDDESATPSMRTFESPDYCRFFTAGVRQSALALSLSGSFGVTALLGCIRAAAYNWAALRPSCLLPAVADRIYKATHLQCSGQTQRPSCTASTSRISLGDVSATYKIEDEATRARVESEVWALRKKHKLLAD